MFQGFKTVQRLWAGFGLGLWLTACGPAAHRPPRTYHQGLDSASNTCIRFPANCPPALGAQPTTATTSVVRPPPQPSPPALSGAQRTALHVASAIRATSLAIDATLELRIREALSQCADEARSTIMLRHFRDRGPTREECAEVIGINEKGEPITRAMQLGNEQHEEALRCAAARLEELKPGGFSILPRYLIDPQTGRAHFISRQQVKALLEQGRGAELLGSIEPDIVIHTGTPQQVQRAFDFKFPCVNGVETPWRRYPEGHPHQYSSQKEVYESSLGALAFRVLPRLGVLP